MDKSTESRFDALDLKQEAQARVQNMLEGLAPEAEIRALADAIAEGPFHEEWVEAGTGGRELEPSARADKNCAAV